MIEITKDWCIRMAKLEEGQEIGAGLVARDLVPTCLHPSYSQDKITGECHCDDCGKLLIDCIGRVLE